MKKNYVMMKMFSVNNKIVMAQNIDEAISLYRGTLLGRDQEVKSAYECRDGELCYVKIATEEDYIATHGEED
jgi:hypothetical protein